MPYVASYTASPHSFLSWWCAVALQGFDAYVGFENYWLKHLPKKILPQSCPQNDNFAAACNQCEYGTWQLA
jgi:hypothetical protein